MFQLTLQCTYHLLKNIFSILPCFLIAVFFHLRALVGDLFCEWSYSCIWRCNFCWKNYLGSVLLLLNLESGWSLLVTSEHVAKSQIVSSISGTQVLHYKIFYRGDVLAHTSLFIEQNISTTVLSMIYLEHIACLMLVSLNSNYEVNQYLEEFDEI